MLCVLIIIGITSAAILHSNKPSADKPQLLSGEGDYAQGIDVSSHNQDIDWQAVAGATDFAIIRCGYRGYGNGDIVEDELFAYNVAKADEAGIPFGVYFYSQATTEAEAKEEAKFAVKAIEKHTPSLPIFIDFEYAYDSNGSLTGRLFNADLTGKEAAQIINAFCEEINKAGLYAGVYSSSSVLTLDVRTTSLNDNIYVWVADYNAALNTPAATISGSIPSTAAATGLTASTLTLTGGYINKWSVISGQFGRRKRRLFVFYKSAFCMKNGEKTSI